MITKEQAIEVAKRDIYSGICFAIDKLEEYGLDCSSYHKEINEYNEDCYNFDLINIEARNRLYNKLGITEIMQEAYDIVEA